MRNVTEQRLSRISFSCGELTLEQIQSELALGHFVEEDGELQLILFVH